MTGSRTETTRRVSRTATAGVALAAVLSACGGDAAPPAPETLLRFDDTAPGDIVGLVADDQRRTVSWLHRGDGTVHELVIDDESALPTVLGSIEVGVDRQQGGLLDQELLSDGRRVVAYTDVRNHLVFATWDGAEANVLWDAGPAGEGAIGGKAPGTRGDEVLLAVGRNVDWFDDALPRSPDLPPRDGDVESDGTIGDQGALLLAPLVPPGAQPAAPRIVAFGHTNPWAVLVSDDQLWAWDNAAGPDPDDPDREDVERIGRADLTPDRAAMARSDQPDRAPTDMVRLPDGRLGVCGFLDNELRAYEVVDGPAGPDSALERAGTVMACNAGAAVFADGTIVTAAQTTDGESLQILRP